MPLVSLTPKNIRKPLFSGGYGKRPVAWNGLTTIRLTLHDGGPSLPHRNHSTDLQSKSLDWLLYDRSLCHEKVKLLTLGPPRTCTFQTLVTLTPNNAWSRVYNVVRIYVVDIPIRDTWMSIQILGLLRDPQLLYK